MTSTAALLQFQQEWAEFEEELALPCVSCDTRATWVMRHNCCDHTQLVCEFHYQCRVNKLLLYKRLMWQATCGMCNTVFIDPTQSVRWERI